MPSLIDESLSWPNKIDIYFYAPGSGGEFFSSLCSIAHLPTRELLISKTLVTNIDKNSGTISYVSPYYFENLNNICITNLGRHVFFYSNYLKDPKEKIDYYRMVLSHAILNFNDKSITPKNFFNISMKRKIFEKINIIMCTHWTDFADKEVDNNRNYGIRLFEGQKYWNVINLDPISEKGQQFVINFAEKVGLRKDNKKIINYFHSQAFKNINLKFPFMDYIINNNFNLIKDYLENRYGPELDHDFIDQALMDYKKIRIDPYL